MREGMTQQGGETGIPILTEVIETPVYGIDTPERRTAPRPPVAPPAAPVTPGIADAHIEAAHEPEPVTGTETETVPILHTGTAALTDPADKAAFDRIAASVRTQVLQELLDRADAALEQRIRDSLADHLQLVVVGLTAQLRQGLQQTLEELLAEAIARELANRQVSKN